MPEYQIERAAEARAVGQSQTRTGHANDLGAHFEPNAPGAAVRVHDNTAAALVAARFRQSNKPQPLLPGRSLLQLQRSYGNRYVQRVLGLARQGEGEAGIDPEVESAIERKRGGGQALDGSVRLQMERAFGSDFSGIRVHTDSEAHALNHAVDAVAFTTGQDIFFRQSAYSPGSSAGRELLAHELTHVVQQGGSSAVQGKLVLGEAGDSYEREADLVARQVMVSLDGSALSEGEPTSDARPRPLQRQCACGGHTASGGECEECRQKREVGLQRRATHEAERSLQRQDDGEPDGGSTDGGAEKFPPIPGCEGLPPCWKTCTGPGCHG